MSAPRLLVCGFEAFPDAPRNPAAAAVERLAAAGWRPAQTETLYLTLPVVWEGSAEAVLAELTARPCQGVLVVGVAVESQAFRVETIARNRSAHTRPDAHGRCGAAPRVLSGGPEQLAVTAPTQAMLEALRRNELPTEISEDAGAYLCNHTLYRLLAAEAAQAVGFLHTPQVREFAAGAAFGLDEVELAVRVAAEALAQALSHPDAARGTA